MKIDWQGTFGALFKKLLNEQKHFVMQKKLKKSAIRLCTSFLPKTFHGTAAGTVISTWKASLKSVCWYPVHIAMLCFDNFCFKDSHCLLPEACRSSAALTVTVTMKMVRLLNLMA